MKDKEEAALPQTKIIATLYGRGRSRLNESSSDSTFGLPSMSDGERSLCHATGYVILVEIRRSVACSTRITIKVFAIYGRLKG